jgi:phosphoribosyl 1,2-cyclic phosphate phosphodiesterase
VPSASGYWGTCDPTEPRNRRTRTSLAIHDDDGEIWLIETGPDLRQQITRVDGVFMTHAHADHLLGMDDLRAIYYAHRKPIPVYGDALTLHFVGQIFEYIVEDAEAPTRHKERQQQDGVLDKVPLSPAGNRFLQPRLIQLGLLTWKGQTVQVIAHNHGPLEALTFRFKDWAYSTDVKMFADDAWAHLKVWFVDCTGITPKRGYTHLEQTLAWVEKVRPQRTILIHMSPEVDFSAVSDQLPTGVELAYDGLQVTP